MPTVEFELDEAGNPILPADPSLAQPESPNLQSFRIVQSDPELSLHPRVLWGHYKRYILWDHRTYYGVLELLASAAIIVSVSDMNENRRVTGTLIQKVCQGLLILSFIVPIHWYSNNKDSEHILSRAQSHLISLVLVTAFTVVLQLFTFHLSDCESQDGWGGCGSEIASLAQGILWLTVPISFLAAFVVWKGAKAVASETRDPLLAELPPAVAHGDTDRLLEDEVTLAWSSVNVADAIEDDSLEPQGQVRL